MGDLGTWVGAVSTLSAVLVAIWLALRADKRHLHDQEQSKCMLARTISSAIILEFVHSVEVLSEIERPFKSTDLTDPSNATLEVPRDLRAPLTPFTDSLIIHLVCFGSDGPVVAEAVARLKLVDQSLSQLQLIPVSPNSGRRLDWLRLIKNRIADAKASCALAVDAASRHRPRNKSARSTMPKYTNDRDW